MSPRLPDLPGHRVMVTDDGVRVHVECECGHYARQASMRAANLAGLRHYIEHCPPGPAREQAENLMKERTR